MEPNDPSDLHENQKSAPAFAELSADAPEDTVQVPTKHSGLGIASTILGAILAILMIVATAVFMTNTDAFLSFEGVTIDPENLTAEQEKNLGIVIVIGLLAILIFILMIISFILGLVGLLKKDRKKLFPIIGIVLSVSPIVFYILTAIFNMIRSA